MKRIIKVYIPIVIFLTIGFLFLQPNPYFRNAIIYTTAEISDYQIFNNRTVENASPQPWRISSNYNKYNITTEDSLLFSTYKTVAYLVIKDTNIIFESYWDNYSEKSLSSSFSITKSIMSLLIGVAIDEQKINSVNDPVSKYIPEFNDPERKEITIRDLLTMSSGLEWDESYYNPFSVTTKAYYGKGLNKLVLKAKRKINPNEKFEYITANPQLLSIILKRVTGKTVSEYASEKLWIPLGAENNASWSLDGKNGDEKAFCCFNSNARDLAKLGQLILNKGNWNGNQVISEDYIKESLTPASHLTDENNKTVDFYGYQWWIANHNDNIVYYARGILGQYIICIPEKNVVITRLGHKRNKEKINHHPSEMFDYIDLALKIAQ